MKVMDDDDLSMLHQTAQFLVDLDEAKKLTPELRKEHERTLEKAREVLEKDKVLEQENKDVVQRLHGDTLMFANMIRQANIMEEVKATATKNVSFWHRFKVMLGWA